VAKRIEGIVNIEEDEERQQAEIRHSEEDLFGFLSKVGSMEFSCIIMAIASIGFVFATNPFSPESSWFFQTFHNETKSYQWISYIAILVALNGVLLGYIFTKDESYQLNNDELEPKGEIANIVFNNYYLSDIYQTVFVKPLLWISPKINLFDRKIIDGLVNSVGYLIVVWASLNHWFERNIINSFVDLVANTSAKIGSYTRQIQNGKAQTYIITIFVCLVFMMILLMVK
jgi:NADH-quinone oxidoreductase subunit L